QATTVMAVAADGESSTVTLTTDFTVVGRVAQFGRGIMEDVSRHLVGQAATCIQSKLEGPPPGEAQSADAIAPTGSASSPTAAAPPPPTPPSQPGGLLALSART